MEIVCLQPGPALEASTSPAFSVGKYNDDIEIIIDDDHIVDRLAERRVLRRLDLRVMPSFILMSLFSFLARANIDPKR